MHLDIITPTQTVFSEDIEELIVPTVLGQIAILPHHINLVTKVVPGEMIVKSNKKDHFIGVTGGFLEVNNNKLTLLADHAVRAEDVEAGKALDAQKRAEGAMKKAREQASDKDMAIAESELRKSILELDIASRRKRRNL